jgi:acid phosphatase
VRATWFVLVSALVCAAADPTYENLNAVSWMQTSAEYRALALQTYRAAENSLLRALADPSWTAALEQTEPASKLPPAVILDLDETVLDNSAYQARLTAEGGSFNDKTWSMWVAESRAGLVPGAAQFLAFAHAHGVALFYVTNRVCDPGKADDPTVMLLRKYNLPLAAGRLRCKTESSGKSPRRFAIAQSHRILLLIGDDYGDFLAAGPAAADRAAAIAPYERWFGERWFVVPNPSYGSWEGAAGRTAKEKLEKLRR